MRLKLAAAALAVVGAVAVLAAPADAAPKKKPVQVVDPRAHTVFTSRDEDGRTRTRIIIQKRSFLDPGTETFPGENSDHNYAYSVGHSPTGILDNTSFGGNRSALPDAFTLPSKNNPVIRF
jgi:hypothetical protein